jgi:hypothetical protein
MGTSSRCAMTFVFLPLFPSEKQVINLTVYNASFNVKEINVEFVKPLKGKNCNA